MSKTTLRRRSYMYSPEKTQIEKCHILSVINSFYGMAESSIHCFKTYTDYFRQVPTMTPVLLDPCLLFRIWEKAIDGIVCIHVEDSICAASAVFSDEEKGPSQQFPSRARVYVKEHAAGLNRDWVAIIDACDRK